MITGGNVVNQVPSGFVHWSDSNVAFETGAAIVVVGKKDSSKTDPYVGQSQVAGLVPNGILPLGVVCAGISSVGIVDFSSSVVVGRQTSKSAKGNEGTWLPGGSRKMRAAVFSEPGSHVIKITDKSLPVEFDTGAVDSSRLRAQLRIFALKNYEKKSRRFALDYMYDFVESAFESGDVELLNGLLYVACTDLVRHSLSITLLRATSRARSILSHWKSYEKVVRLSLKDEPDAGRLLRGLG